VETLKELFRNKKYDHCTERYKVEKKHRVLKRGGKIRVRVTLSNRGLKERGKLPTLSKARTSCGGGDNLMGEEGFRDRSLG